MAVYSSQYRCISCSPLEVIDLHTSKGRGFRWPSFFAGMASSPMSGGNLAEHLNTGDLRLSAVPTQLFVREVCCNRGTPTTPRWTEVRCFPTPWVSAARSDEALASLMCHLC